MAQIESTEPAEAHQNGVRVASDVRYYNNKNNKESSSPHERQKVTKGRSTVYHRTLHVRNKESQRDILHISQNQPILYDALMQLPPKLCRADTYGVYMNDLFYKGSRRNRNYLRNFLRQRYNAISRLNKGKGNQLSLLTTRILKIVDTYGRFIPYDRLLAVLRPYGENHDGIEQHETDAATQEDIERIVSLPPEPRHNSLVDGASPRPTEAERLREHIAVHFSMDGPHQSKQQFDNYLVRLKQNPEEFYQRFPDIVSVEADVVSLKTKPSPTK